MLALGASDETGAKIGHEGATRVVAFDDRIVGSGDDTAQIAQIELLEVTLGGLGAVEPIGHTQLGEKILRHLQHALLGHGRLALGGQCFVRSLQFLANGLHALEGQLGNGTLVLGNRGEHFFAMRVASLQTLGARTLREFGRSLETRTARTVGATLATFAIGGTSRSLSVAARSTFARFTVATRATITSVVTTIAATITRTAIALVALRELLCDRLEVAVVGDERQRFDLGGLGAILNHGENLDAVDVELGVDLHHVARLGAGGKDRSVENTLGLACTGRSPCPGAVGS